MARGKTGFTLIELLVVIAIIAILAGIMFPVFSRAREKARQAHCITNLHQLGLMLREYALDRRGRYPMPVDNSRDALSVDPASWTGLAVVTGKSPLVCPNDRGRGAEFTYNNDSKDGTDPAHNLYNYYGYLPNGYADDGSTYDPSAGPPPAESGVSSWRDFPFLRSRRPPPYTIVTHCTFHRKQTNMDLVLRINGNVDRINHVMNEDADAKDPSTWTDGSKYRFNWVACRDISP